MPEIIEIPGMTFRGRKIYLESQDYDDEAVAHFVAWVEHYTGNIVKDNAFYRMVAKETLALGIK